MITEALKTLSYGRLTQIGFILFGTLLAPFMFVFEFKQNIFSNNDFIHLILISVCIGLPVALIIFILEVINDAGVDPADPAEKLKTRFRQMANCSLMTGVGFYLPCCWRYFQPTLSLREAIGFMSFFYGGIVFTMISSILRGGTKGLHERMQKYIEQQKKKEKK